MMNHERIQMKTKLFKGSKRTRIFTVVSTLGILIVIVLNLLLTLYTGSNAAYIDTSYEGLYTVTKAMKSECKELFSELKKNGDGKVKITFCTDPDYLMGSETTRLPYVLAQKLEKLYPDSVELETVNVVLNPTAVYEYMATSLSKINASDIIVSYGGRFRIASAKNFWVTGTANNKYFNGEYRFATLIKSVTAIDMPSAYFLTGHGETYYDPADPKSEMSKSLAEFAQLLENRGLSIKTLNISDVDRVPEDCALLIINAPTEDFSYEEDKLGEISYVSDIEKIDRYLVMNQGAVMVAKDHSVKLPIFESFLKTWGFSFGDGLVKDPESSLEDEDKTYTNLIAEYDKDENSYGYAIYGEFADLSSAPVTIIENAGNISCSYPANTFGVMAEQGSHETTRTYVPFLTTSETGKVYQKDPETGEYNRPGDGEGNLDLAALTVRSHMNPTTTESLFSYLFCVNSADFFSGSFLARDSSYANYEIVSALVDNISRFDAHASVDLGGTSLNSISAGGKKLITTDMTNSSLAEDQKIYSNKYKNDNKDDGLILIMQRSAISNADKTVFAVLVFVPVVALAVIGIVVTLKRRFL